jgi:hypothetical protein
MVEQFLHILHEGTSDEVVEYFGDRAKYERIQIFCALASYYTSLGREERDRNKKSEAFNKAASHLQQAQRISLYEQLPKLGAGQLALAQVRPCYVTHFTSCFHPQLPSHSHSSTDISFFLPTHHACMRLDFPG